MSFFICSTVRYRICSKVVAISAPSCQIKSTCVSYAVSHFWRSCRSLVFSCCFSFTLFSHSTYIYLLYNHFWTRYTHTLYSLYSNQPWRHLAFLFIHRLIFSFDTTLWLPGALFSIRKRLSYLFFILYLFLLTTYIITLKQVSFIIFPYHIRVEISCLQSRNAFLKVRTGRDSDSCSVHILIQQCDTHTLYMHHLNHLYSH